MVQWQRIRLPAQETRVQFLAWEDALEEETTTHSSILACKTPWAESLEGYSPCGHKELNTTEHTGLVTLFHLFMLSPTVGFFKQPE